MKRIGSDEIIIKTVDGKFRLGYPEPNTVEGARAVIDKHNAGSDPKYRRSYLICCVENYDWYEADGSYVRSEKLTNVIERYPADL
jgi:hypothetical protein